MKPNRHFDAGTAASFSEAETASTQPSIRLDSANTEPHLRAIEEELPDEAIDKGAPWQSREELQTEADRENHMRKDQQREATRSELIQLQRDEALAAAQKYETSMSSMRANQAVELRRREVAIQNQIDALRPWNLLQKRELARQLAITTERLNGLTQSTPDMRHRERQATTVQTVREAIPGRSVQKTVDSRPAHIKARDEMHRAANERDNIGFFGRLFGKKTYNAARGKALGSSARYGQELRKGHGEATISQEELDDLNDQLDRVA